MQSNHPHVAILMSTYNGEKYLTEQIRSIQKQTNHFWHLYIRDDGSSDNTVSLLNSFSQNDERITFINKGKQHNVGVIQSFLSLLNQVSADYYMFSDQDDYWLPNKIGRALELVSRYDSNGEPICVHTELQEVSSKLEPLGLMKNGRVWSDSLHFLFGNCVTGCTMLINESLKNKLMLNELDENKLMMHDWWFALVASAFGKVVYDHRPSIEYRQHLNNVVGGTDSQSIKSLVKRSLNVQNELEAMQKMVTMINEFKRLYQDQVSGDLKKYVMLYGDLPTKSSLSYNLNLVRRVPPVRSHLRGRLLLSFLLIKYHESFLKD